MPIAAPTGLSLECGNNCNLVITGGPTGRRASFSTSYNYYLAGAVGSVIWSVNNAGCTLSNQSNNGVTVNVLSTACNFNSGGITLTATDSLCTKTKSAQAGTWVSIFSCQAITPETDDCLAEYPSGWREIGLFRYKTNNHICCSTGGGYCFKGTERIACWNAYIAAGGIRICSPVAGRDCSGTCGGGTGQCACCCYYTCYDAINRGDIQEWQCP